MGFLRRLLNPLVAFIGIQLVWIAVVVFWVYWFMGTHRRLRELAEQYSPELLTGGVDWFILAEGILLLVAILVGVYVIFLYWNRQRSLYRSQHTFISQVTHELKSPLASLQLHLETIRLRHPDPAQLEGFLDTMLGDTDRLHSLINNLLSASRLEQRGVRFSLRTGDLSALVVSYLEKRRGFLPEGAGLEVAVEPGLHVRMDPESLETALRNLLENAVLYTVGVPRIRVGLRAEGRFAHLTVADSGRGLEPRHRKKVFRMFYRVRRSSERTIRGTGLGLFIVRTAVRMHKGRVWMESGGLGRGTTVHIQLPLVSGPGDREAA
ncbi:MAG TPA: HAMP domain-containing sensor histidine kinase [Deferrisomatales bacterium]|nr:HAMP domain-containing sensor histidine kinase [Deferrisomatales bacterium]